ncbi:MAG: CHRD domain-containing protein [Burkholderiaceae bacterium]|jgi:hypothetical protein|nr:CHRD domain-containing protein [Burkholderiaceae bacterium]
MAFAPRLPTLLALALLTACAGRPLQQASPPVLAQGQAQEPAQPQAPLGREPDRAAFKAVLSGSQLSPAVSGAGSGELVAALDRNTGLLRWKISFAGLSGPVRRAMFHRTEPDGKPGAEALPVGRNVTSPYEGRASLAPAQQADLLAGRWHVRLSTARNPQGEIGGPLIEQR